MNDAASQNRISRRRVVTRGSTPFRRFGREAAPTMTTKADTTDDGIDEEPTNPWHALPTLIGEAITEPPTQRHTGGYSVVKEEDGTIHVYRIVELAGSVDELEVEADRMLEWYDYVTGNEHLFTIPVPDEGWADGIEHLPERIWGGYA